MTAVVPEPHALHGLGGVGKTQMAIEYVYRYRDTYDVVWWIPSDQPILAKTALAGLASHLGVRTAAVSGIEDAARDVLDALRRGEPYNRWLLVFDNADQPEDLRDLIPRDQGHVLITSRNHRWASLVDAISVDVFHREESVEFLTKRVRNAIGPSDADRLADELGDLPLALEQAGALLFERGMSVAEYLQQLAERTSQLLSQGRPADYQLPMTAALSVSVANLNETLPEALDLLRVCAFFGSEPIPREAISRAPDGLRPELVGLMNDTIRLGRAIGELGRYALAKLDITRRTIQIHRLVQKLIQDELSPAEQGQFRHEVHRLMAAYAAADVDDETSWPRYDSLLAHVAPAKVADCADPELRGFAIRVLRYLYRDGDYQAALTLADDFIERWSAQSGPEHPDVIRAKLERADVLREMGDYAAAAALNEDVLTVAEKVLGLDDDVTLRALRGSGADLRALGDYRAALDRDEQALRRYEAKHGPDHPGSLRAAHNLALSYALLSDYARARELQDRAYAGWLRRGSTMVRSSMLNALNGLACAVRLSGEYAEACDLGEDAYAIGLETLGAEHNRTLRTGTDLAISLRQQGEYERAEAFAEEIHERCVRLYGLNSPDTLAAATCLSNIWRTVGKIDQAKDLAADSATRYADIYPPDHPYRYACLTNLAVLQRLQGDAQSARKLNEHALAGLEVRAGRDHDFSLTVAVNLASDMAALGEVEPARRLDEETLERLRRLFGTDHPLTLACAANLSADLRAAGRTEEADDLFGETRAGYERTLGLNHPHALVFLNGSRMDADFDPPAI